MFYKVMKVNKLKTVLILLKDCLNTRNLIMKTIFYEQKLLNL